MQTQKLITTLSPYSVTHIPHFHFNIWGAVAELPLIMFEIRLYCFHTLEMQKGKRTDSKGACFRNIYYPIKMGASESSNYLQPASGMMNGMVGFVQPSTHLSLVCWRSAPIYTLRTPSIF